MAVAVLVPWTVRNAVRFHTFVPVSNNAATLVDGANCDATYGGDQLGLWRESFSTAGDAARTLPQAQGCFEGFDIADPHFDEVKVANKHLARGRGLARHHLGSLPKVAVARVLRTWGLYAPRQQVSFESLEGRPRAWQMRGTLMFWVLAPLAIAGGVMLRRRRHVIFPLVRDHGDGDDRRRVDLRPAALPDRGGTGDPRARGRAAHRARARLPPQSCNDEQGRVVIRRGGYGCDPPVRGGSAGSPRVVSSSGSCM